MTPEPTLTPIQQQVLELLAAGSSAIAAAETAGVHRNTISNWRRTTPAFNSALNGLLRDRALVHQEDLAELVPQSLKVLRTILHNESASVSAQLRAALTVLKMAASAEAEPEIRPSLNIALATQIRAISEQQAQIQQNMHNFAQPAPLQPIRRPVEPGRNSQCPCGSGIKYKRCCANPAPLPVSHAAA